MNLNSLNCIKFLFLIISLTNKMDCSPYKSEYFVDLPNLDVDLYGKFKNYIDSYEIKNINNSHKW